MDRLTLPTVEVAVPPATKKQQILAAILAQIEDGTLRPGDPLPSHRELRAQFECSITPVRDALAELKLRGYVVGVPGAAVYVASRPPTT